MLSISSPILRRCLARPAILALTGIIVHGLWLAATADRSFAQQLRFPAGRTPTVVTEDPYGIYLPTDRTLSRGMSRAGERLAQREYNEALDFLQQMLDREEDAFLDGPADSEHRRGLKATARELLANLPPQGREMYRLLHATAARRQLEAALESSDRDALAQVVRRYLLTPPGYEAALVLAQMEFDRGHPLAAAHLYQQLLDDPQSAALFEPQLSLLTAVSWDAAGRPDRAATTLRALAENQPDATVLITGGEQRLPSAKKPESDFLAWLHRAAGPPRVREASDPNWLTARGDAVRNADRQGGAPHLSARWQARVVNDPRFESFLATRRQQFQQHGIVAIPAARPIAVGDVVLMRTPQNVVAVDWQTGKRIWETREEESGVRDQFLAEFMSGNNRDEWPALSHPLEQRMWDDTLTVSLSSDGERVFALSGMSLASRDENVVWGMGPAFGGPYQAASPTNRLTAHELATEGKLAWEIDGANASGPLAGAFFLGTPLAVDDTLYVMAEIRSAVYLLALEPGTGRLLWRQQLAGLEQGITLDPQRRLNVATPSYAAGMLICPTSAGMVVAVDVIRREFAWVYRYPRQSDSLINIRGGWQGRPENPFVRDNNRWLDAAVIVADGRLIVSPPESAEIHCLDLSSGKLLWKHPRESFLFVACVDRGNVLLVTNDSLAALRVEDGATGWPAERVALPEGVQPTGLGYLSQGRYFLPLTSGQVVAVDLEDGNLTRAVDVPSDVVLGNLICHRGTIISQSAVLLDKYEQMEVLRQRAEAALARNPRDATAIRDLAEMRRLDGRLPEAVQMLKQAFDIDPADPLTRDMLADCLLEALSADYSAYQQDLPLLRDIIYRPQQQLDLLRIDAQGLHASGQRLEALEAYLRLVDVTTPEPQLLAIAPDHSVRSDGWLSARLHDLWSACSAGEQAEFARKLEVRQQSWSDPPTAGQLRSLLAHFGSLPGMDEIRLQLAHELIARRELLDAEIELLKLEHSQAAEHRTAAAEIVDDWLVATGRRESRDRDSDRFWPRGRVEIEVAPSTAASRRNATRRAQQEYQLGMRRLRIEQDYRAGLGVAQWLISQDGSRLVGRDEAGRDIFRMNLNQDVLVRRFPSNIDWIQVAQLGDLLYLTLGGQIIALDTRRAGEDRDGEIAWQAFPAGRYPAISPRATRRGSQAVYHAWSERKRVPGPASLLVGGLGPVTPGGVVLQEQQRLRCVDPVSGETLWSRSDIPAGCELFGDDQYVIAASVSEAATYVIRMDDGRLVERRRFPVTQWLLTAGRNVAHLRDVRSASGPMKSLRIVDAVSGKTLFAGKYSPAVRMTTVEPYAVAVVDPPDRIQWAHALTLSLFHIPPPAGLPEGRFQWIDVRTGRVRIDQPLPTTTTVKSMHAMISGHQLFVMINSETRQRPSLSIGVDYPLVDGQVYAFDLREGGMMWPGPAYIQRRGISLTQPQDIPVLVFVDRVLKRDAGGGGSKLRLLCLDKQTGATVYRNDELPDSSPNQFRVRTNRGERHSVSVEMSTQIVRLAFSDRPRPPEPPANDFVEAPRSSRGDGLWGVGRRMGDVIQGALQDPGAPN